jgi:L-2-hydroxyglutarate oxidase LhgO
MTPTTISIMLITVAKIGRWIDSSEIFMRALWLLHAGAGSCGRVYYAFMYEVDAIVVGAGVIGLAVARALARSGRETLVLEAAGSFGTETSARNSEVIHAGIYYPRGSLKARLCVAGREQLYRYCEHHGVPHRRCGKLIVATSETQLPQLEAIRQAAMANGVQLEKLSATQAREMEPQLRCVGALHSPLTGIVDSHAYMVALLGEAEAAGATLVCGSRVTGGRLESAAVIVESSEVIRTELLVNAAGLGAPALAAGISGLPAAEVPRQQLAKGSYFGLAGRSPFTRLVYPIPEPGGLGVHVTLDMAGRARFGPDVEWVESIDYEVDARRAARFYPVIREYWPHLADGALLPAYAGVRPKLSGPGEPAADFRIERMGPVINLFGIESPGLTASLAIADEVLRIAAGPPSHSAR